MSDSSSGAGGKPMEQPGNDLSEANGSRSVTPDNSDKTSPPKNLSDMPIDVVGLFIKRSNYKEQLILRKVSKSLRALVDQLKPACSSIGVMCGPKQISVFYGGSYIIYASPKWRLIDLYKRFGKTVLVRDDYEKIAFDDLASALKNPKLHLEHFNFDYNDVDEKYEKTLVERKKNAKECFEKFENVLKSLNLQLSVKEFTIYQLYSCGILSVLPYLKPGALKEIEINGQNKELWDGDFPTETMEKLISLDQWKQCGKLKLHNVSDIIPTEKIDNFKKVKICEDDISDEKLIRFRDQIAKIDIFESISIWRVRYEDLPESICGPPAPPNKKTEIVSHYPIPDSDYYLEFMLIQDKIAIVKKKREERRSRSEFVLC